MCDPPSDEACFYYESDDEIEPYSYSDSDSYAEHESLLSDRRSAVEAFKYKELEIDEVESLLNLEIETLCNSIHVPPSIAKLLLITHDWDVERVRSTFLSDPIRLLMDQCLLPPSTSRPTVSDSRDVMTAVQAVQRMGFYTRPYFNLPLSIPDSMCSICLCPPSKSVQNLGHHQHDESHTLPLVSSDPHTPTPSRSVQSPGLYGMSCGHRFCVDCWSCYLTTQVGEGLCVEIKCMAFSCNICVPEDFLLSLLQGSPIRDKFITLVFHRMVTSHPSLRFCVGPDCPIVMKALEPTKARRVTCSRCNSQFCFMCGEAYHAPTSCATIKRWFVKCRDDSSTATYMAAHTKDCPECHVCIEKNGGCNHMQCTHCSYEFCWVCLGAWSTHKSQYYTCCRYSKVVDPSKDRARLLAREALKRYVFYYDRWANHERSLRLEQEHRAAVSARIHEKVLKKDGTWIDWQYLLTAADTLRNCRYTLQYTYPMAYYSDKLKNKDLFEYVQALLEAEVEGLAWKIEHAEITDRADLQNAMDVCEKHRLSLLHEFISD